jgi:hypothetical protein
MQTERRLNTDESKPREFVVRYWPPGIPIPDGWKRHSGLDGTLHAAYNTMIVPIDQKDPAE